MTRRRSRRILGMTVAQLLILACMGLALCGTLGTGVWMLSSAYGVAIAWPTRVVPPTALIIPTSTSIPTVTLTPEPTLTPTATPVPYEGYVPAGWKQYRTGKAEIWLPDTFAIIGDPDAVQQEIAPTYKAIGLQELLDQRAKEQHSYELLFRHGPPIGSHYVPFVSVKEYGRNGRSLDQFADQLIQNLGITSTVVERSPFEFYQTEGERLVIQTNYSNAYVNFYHYLVVDGNTVWEIVCDVFLIDSYTFEPTFDDITRTFRSVKP